MRSCDTRIKKPIIFSRGIELIAVGDIIATIPRYGRMVIDVGSQRVKAEIIIVELASLKAEGIVLGRFDISLRTGIDEPVRSRR